MRKLRVSDIVAIKKMILTRKYTQAEIAKQFGVSRSTISDITRGVLFPSVKPDVSSVARGNLVQARRVPAEPKPEFLRIPPGEQQEVEPSPYELYLMGRVEKLRKEANDLRAKMRVASDAYTSVTDLAQEFIPAPRRPRTVTSLKSDKDTVEETAVLLLSDLHADSVIHLSETDCIEEYNFGVCQKRMQGLVQSVTRYCFRTLANYKFDRLVIFGLGDYTNGTIHKHENYFGDQITADLAIGGMIAEAVCQFADHFDQVYFHNVVGNHGRMTPEYRFEKKYCRENHDHLIAKIAEAGCKRYNNVKFGFADGLSDIVAIRGKRFHLSHGHGKRGASSVWSRSQELSQKLNSLHHGSIDYFVTGHYHSPGECPINGSTLLANGSFMVTDPYAYQSLQVAGTPTQLLFGVHEHHGATWRLPINLLTAVRRYAK